MINQILEAAAHANNSECLCGAVTFIEEWVPKVVTRIEELERQLAEAKTLAAMTEAELLEVQEKIKELE